MESQQNKDKIMQKATRIQSIFQNSQGSSSGKSLGKKIIFW
jgi:hypothetical protein